MTKKNFVLVCLVALTLSPACGKASTSPSAIIGGVWKIRSFETSSGSIIGTSNTNGYTVSFLDGGKLAARADCNTCNGSYAISGDSLQVSGLACTKAICASGSYDKLFLDILTNASSFGVQGTELSIVSPNSGTMRMIQ